MKDAPILVQLPPHRVRQLDTLSGVRQEMVSVYRAARKGGMKSEDMSRFVFALRCIAQVIETSDLEQRMRALEARGITLPVVNEQEAEVVS
jgi:hypothetical protein